MTNTEYAALKLKYLDKYLRTLSNLVQQYPDNLALTEAIDTIQDDVIEIRRLITPERGQHEHTQ